MAAVAGTWSATAANNNVRLTINTAASGAKEGGVLLAHTALLAGITKHSFTAILANLLPRASRDCGNVGERMLVSILGSGIVGAVAHRSRR